MPPLSVVWRIYVPNMLCIATITSYLSLRRGPDWLLRAESPSQTHDAQLLNQSVDETTASGVHHVNSSEAFEIMRKKGFIAPFSYKCPPQHELCPSGIPECVNKSHSPRFLCDGVKDCSDNSDEAGCTEQRRCGPFGFMHCPSGVCTHVFVRDKGYDPPAVWHCDGFTHCLDGSDEDPKFCAGYKCSTNGAIECPGPSKQCIAPVSTRFEHDETWKSKFRKFQDYRRQLSWVGSIPKGKVSTICDGEVNCEDGSDEDPALCASFSCNTGTLKCANFCLPATRLCNGITDCPAGEDEDPALCGSSFDCGSHGWGFERCPSGVGCYSPSRKNQRKLGPQCLDQSDAAATKEPEVADHPMVAGAQDCSARSLDSCPSGNGCVLQDRLCDAVFNCEDHSDEAPSFCSTFNCSSRQGHVQCPSGTGCVQNWLVCDGYADCLDGSDEWTATCTNYTAPGCTLCPSGVGCTSPEARCNGVPGDGWQACSDHSDEDPAFCATYPCWGRQVKCENGKCVPGELCDGHMHCKDGSDEDPDYCLAASCPLGSEKCRDGVHCFSISNKCDLHRNCEDGSDESVDTCADFECPPGKTKCPGPSGLVSRTAEWTSLAVATCKGSKDDTGCIEVCTASFVNPL